MFCGNIALKCMPPVLAVGYNEIGSWNLRSESWLSH